MSRAACVVIVAACAACSSDPTLAVSVTHPSETGVERTTVTVYESDALACTDIEFARIDDVTLAALVITEADITPATSGVLENISRTAKKVIVARGYDARGGLVTAGCLEKREVIGHDTVAITTVRAAVVALQRASAINAVTVTLTDGNGMALADARPVRWTVYGPAGSTAATPANVAALPDGSWEPTLASCASGGTLTVHPNPPSVLGGYEVQIRVSWAVQQPPAYTSFTAETFGSVSVPGVTLAVALPRYCAIRSKGTIHRLVCLGTDNHAYDLALAVLASGSVGATVMSAQAVTNPVAVVSVPVGSTTDRDVYAVSDKGVLTGLFMPDVPVTSTTPLFGALVAVKDAIAMPACGALTAKLLILGTNLGVTQVEVDGSGPRDFGAGNTFALDRAGCVTQLQASGATLAQVASLKRSASGDVMLIRCLDSTSCSELTTPPVTKGTGVGFTGGVEPRIVVSSFDATGVILRELVLAPALATVERDRLPAASLPQHIASGQFDRDSEADLFFDLATRTATVSAELAYGRKVGTENLEALSSPQMAEVVDLVTGPLTREATDDVVILTTTGVAVVPMGIALGDPVANTDATCMP